MPTTQSEDPNESVDRPRHYNQHVSGIETIELIEHLPGNLHSAVKYIWRCGLKQSEKPIRDLKAALWYTKREGQRIELFELDGPRRRRTDILWRPVALRVIQSDFESLLAAYLRALLANDFDDMEMILETEIHDLEQALFEQGAVGP